MEKLKILADWRVSKLPQLVDIIKEVQEVHDNQLLDIRGVLHGRGNFELFQQLTKLPKKNPGQIKRVRTAK